MIFFGKKETMTLTSGLIGEARGLVRGWGTRFLGKR